MSRKSSVASWSDSPREQSETNGEDAVKANDKLQKHLTEMLEEHRALIFSDSFKSEMQSLDDEKAALLAVAKSD